MKIFDPLYGEVELSEVQATIARTPEFRRLSHIRLLNAASPTLATLGEIRRYSHTLGVAALNLDWRQENKRHWRTDELDALEAAVLLHDIATPPFAHLFEYMLKRHQDWSHEFVIDVLLKGESVPENRNHQIFGGNRLRVMEELAVSPKRTDLVFAILERKHPLFQLILGTLDLDNIDNVLRMAWALGCKYDVGLARELASNITVSKEGVPLLRKKFMDHIKWWMETRRRAYEILVFDQETVASQAVMMEALQISMKKGRVKGDDWTLTDEELVSRLSEDEETRPLMTKEYYGRLPEHIATVQIDEPMAALGGAIALQGSAEDAAADCSIEKPLIYVFEDKGSFEKRLEFTDPEAGKWSIGEKSSSTVVYLFTRARGQTRRSTVGKFVQSLSRRLNITQESILKVDADSLPNTQGPQGALGI